MNLADLGVQIFDGSAFGEENPELDLSAGLCIIGTDLADNIQGTQFDDLIFGGRGRTATGPERDAIDRSRLMLASDESRPLVHLID